METTNFKRRGKTLCAHGHLHSDPTSARMCDVAWRLFPGKAKLEGIDELRAELARIVFKGEVM